VVVELRRAHEEHPLDDAVRDAGRRQQVPNAALLVRNVNLAGVIGLRQGQSMRSLGAPPSPRQGVPSD
jgi:hypothetical protein